MRQGMDFTRTASYSFLFTVAAAYLGARAGISLHSLNYLPDFDRTGVKNLATISALLADITVLKLSSKPYVSQDKKIGVFAGAAIATVAVMGVNLEETGFISIPDTMNEQLSSHLSEEIGQPPSIQDFITYYSPHVTEHFKKLTP